MKNFEKGESMRAVVTRDVAALTKGRVYKCLNGTEPGIFETRPYVTVVDDFGKNLTCHQRRFEEV